MVHDEWLGPVKVKWGLELGLSSGLRLELGIRVSRPFGICREPYFVNHFVERFVCERFVGWP